MTKVVNLLSAKAELGAPMISMYLLGNPDHYASHKFVPFYWRQFVSEAKRAFQANDSAEVAPEDKVAIIKKKGKIIGLSPVQDYVHRAEELQDISLYEWVRCYERIKISTRGENLPEDLSGLEEEQHTVQPHEASLQSVPDLDLLSSQTKRVLKRNIFRFGTAHPLSDTHASRYINNNDHRVPNFIDASLPRRDKGDREHYCCTMLTIFKPWRTGVDLKGADASWDEAFNSYHFTEEQETFMNNFNVKYECLDARDDHRAQMKKDGTNVLFSSWDSTELEGEELPGSLFQPPSDQDEVGEDELQTGVLHLRQLREMESVKLMLSLLGWTTAKETAQIHGLIKPDKVLNASQWEAEVEKVKQDEITRKQENNRVSVAASGPAPNNETAECNVIKVVDKSYLCRSFRLDPHSELVVDTIETYFLNAEQERAFRIIANHAISSEPDQLRMYLGGMGGMGKTQVIKALTHFFASRKEAHRFVVVAPTGTAAALLRGSTYHSMFGIYGHTSESRIGLIKSRLQGVDYVFLDEVSMLSARDLNKIHGQLCKILGTADKPFGGMNMVFSGDFAQLPPAIGGEKVSLYSRFIGVVSSDLKSQEEAIGKALWHQVTTVVILRQNMRQRSQTPDDVKLRKALENMRYKACTTEDIAFLRTRILSSAPGRASICDDNFRNVSIITGTNLHKDEINRLGALRFAQESGQILNHFYSDDTEKVNAKEAEGKNAKYMKSLTNEVQKALWSSPPSSTDKHIPGTLSLCIGMPVMIRYNYATELCMTRGQEGYVVGWQAKKGLRNQVVLDTLFVELKEPPHNIKIDGLPDNVVPIYPTTNTVRVTLPSGNQYFIQRKQVEVLVNFAMTDFASQGKTRVYNVADLNNLSSHQAYYTALSRSATAEGTLIVQGFNSRKITGGCSGFLRQEFQELELLDSITALMYENKLPPRVFGETRNELIHNFRTWKGLHYVPKDVHNAIRWSKRDPLVSSVADLPIFVRSNTRKVLTTPKSDGTSRRQNKRRISQVQSEVNGTTAKKSKCTSVEMREEEPTVSAPRGLRWENNSCAYDSVFTLLLHIWKEVSPAWQDGLVPIENNNLRRLFSGFNLAEEGSTSIERARDDVRRLLHDQDPTDMSFGRYTSVDRVLESIFTTEAPNAVLTRTCPRGHVKATRYSNGCCLLYDVGSYPSTEHWMTAIGKGTATSRSCHQCFRSIEQKRRFNTAPPILALEWSGKKIGISERLHVAAENQRNIPYVLRGVVYYGSSHYVAVFVSREEQLWYYDGTRDGGAMQLIGDLRTAPDLSHAKGKTAVAAIYVRDSTV